jgi:hypothetical protein
MSHAMIIILFAVKLPIISKSVALELVCFDIFVANLVFSQLYLCARYTNHIKADSRDDFMSYRSGNYSINNSANNNLKGNGMTYRGGSSYSKSSDAEASRTLLEQSNERDLVPMSL